MKMQNNIHTEYNIYTGYAWNFQLRQEQGEGEGKISGYQSTKWLNTSLLPNALRFLMKFLATLISHTRISTCYFLTNVRK